MRKCVRAMRVVVPVFLGLLLLPALVAAGPSAINVTGTLNYLSGQTYRFDYALENVDVQPAVAGFVVFFDNDGGNRSDFVSYEAPAGWEDVFVVPEGPDGSWNIEWDELYGTNRILPGEILEGFSVTFTWNDPNSLPTSQFFEAWNGEAHEGYTVVVPGASLLGSIEGTIVAVCATKCGDTTTTPATGISVDLYSVDHVLLQIAATDDDGHYSFSGLAIGDYKVAIVTPSGFRPDEETKTAAVSVGQATVVDFELTCLEIRPHQRCLAYWQYQFNYYVSGHRCFWWPRPNESLADLHYYMEQIRIHFNENLLNPVTLVEIDADTDSLLALRRLLTLNWDNTMNDLAKQQAVALLLNVVSLKISQAQVISWDGANVSQAITFCDSLITDKNPCNDLRAWQIGFFINLGIRVPSGWIPTSTPIIYYERDRQGAIVYLGKGYPNPFSSTASIAFALKGNGLVPVGVKVFDVTGRVVKTLISDALEPGQHSVSWNGMSDEGAKVSSGIYFYELRTPTSVATGKLVYRR